MKKAMAKPRTFYDHDGRHPLIYMYEPPMQKEEYESAVDELAGTSIDALMFCLGDGRTVLHDTEVGEIDAVLPLNDFRCTNLADSHVLVTYQIECYGGRTNRSSIWHRTDTSWVMDFHQGTPPEDG